MGLGIHEDGGLIRIGHKGADALVPGNTLASFERAVEIGVDLIEFDVLWLPDAHLPLEERAPLVVAHDWEDAGSRTPLALTEALDAFLEPPLDRVQIDLDVKLPGREEEMVDALRERFGDRFSTVTAVRELHGRDESAYPTTPPDAVLFCETTAEVAEVVALV